MGEVTIHIPEKEPQKRSPSLHGQDENRVVSLQDGPSIAFTQSEIRVYDPEWDEFIALSYKELLRLLADAYEVDPNQDNDQ